MYKFAAASPNESIVFGSARPGSSAAHVRKWIEFMRDWAKPTLRERDIQRVCCLLTQQQLNRYGDLLDNYRQAFGSEHVCWAPIEDFGLATPELLVDSLSAEADAPRTERLRQRILPFLVIADRQQEKVVVHCSGGIGRTGHILAVWLVARRGFSTESAIAAIRQTGRNSYEAIIAAPFKGRNPWRVAVELKTLLSSSREA